MGASTIAYMIFAFFVFIGVVFSGVLKKPQKQKLGDTMGETIQEKLARANEELKDEDPLAADPDSIVGRNEGRRLTWTEKKERELKRSHTNMTMQVYLAIMFGACIALYMFGYLIFKDPLYAFFAALFGAIAPKVVLSVLISKNVNTFNQNLVKALRRMASNMRAGGTLKQAIVDVCKSNSMPDAIRTEFAAVLSDTEFGLPVADAFYKLYERVGSEEVRTIALTIEIQTKKGGNLAEALENEARLINRRALEEADVKATMAQTKSSGILVSMIPLILTAVLNVISPSYFDSFYAWGGGLGKTIALMCYVLIGFGIFVMNKLTTFKY